MCRHKNAQILDAIIKKNFDLQEKDIKKRKKSIVKNISSKVIVIMFEKNVFFFFIKERNFDLAAYHRFEKFFLNPKLQSSIVCLKRRSGTFQYCISKNLK